MIPQLSFFQYNPIYQGAPIEELGKAYEMSANRYDKNLENYNKLETFFSSIKALPLDKDYIVNKGKQTQEEVKNLASGLQGSKRWDLANDVIQKMQASYTQDPKLNAIRESYLNFQDGEKLKQQMRAKGETPFELTDIKDHRSYDDEGNVNIYQPVIQVKGDYVKEADEIFKNVAPDVVAANLQPSEIEGILQGKTVRGFSREKLMSVLNNVQDVYNNTDAGAQHKLFIAKNAPDKNPDQYIRDFLFSVGNLRTFREERVDRMIDPSFTEAQRTERLMMNLEAKMKLKQMKGSPNYDDDPLLNGLIRTESLRTIDSGIKDQKTGKNKMIKSNALMISNAEIIKDLSDSYFTGDGSRIVPLDKTKKFDFSKNQVKGFKIKGFALDEENGTGTLGGAIGQLTYLDEDDKEQYMNVVLQSADDNHKNIFSTHQSVSNILRKHNRTADNEPKLGHGVADTSDLLGGGGGLAFYVDKNNEIRPQVKTTDGKWRLVKDNELQSLSLKEKYSMQDIQELTANRLASSLKSYVKTAKQVTEE